MVAEQSALGRRLRKLAALDLEYYALNKPNYLDCQCHGMTAVWREKMVCWFEGLARAFDLSTTTVSAAVDYLDRYLSRKSCTPLNYQLVAVGALFLATKVEEPKPLTTSDLCMLTEGVFSREDIRLVELELLCTLTWRLHPPAAETFVRLYVDLLAEAFAGPAPRAEVEATALDFAAEAQRDYEFVAFPRHVVAAAAVLGALREHDAPREAAEAWTRALDRHGVFPRAAAADAVAPCGLRLVAKCAPHRLPGLVGNAPPASPDQEVRDFLQVDAVSKSTSGGVEPPTPPAPARHSPTDVTADVYAYDAPPKRARDAFDDLFSVDDAMDV